MYAHDVSPVKMFWLKWAFNFTSKAAIVCSFKTKILRFMIFMTTISLTNVAYLGLWQPNICCEYHICTQCLTPRLIYNQQKCVFSLCLFDVALVYFIFYKKNTSFENHDFNNVITFLVGIKKFEFSPYCEKLLDVKIGSQRDFQYETWFNTHPRNAEAKYLHSILFQSESEKYMLD